MSFIRIIFATTLILVFSQSLFADDHETKPTFKFPPYKPDKGPLDLTFGYGVNFFVILPTPFLELGFNFTKISLRGNLAYVLAYGRMSAEISYNSIFSSKYSFFINAGESAIIQGWASKTLGVGIESQSTEFNKYYRLELVKYESKETTPGFGETQSDYYAPHFTIGYRM